jgi:hypothetical protein
LKDYLQSPGDLGRKMAVETNRYKERSRDSLVQFTAFQSSFTGVFSAFSHHAGDYRIGESGPELL